MATISTLDNALSAGTHTQAHARVNRVYEIWNEIDLAAAATAKGSALAAADVIECIRVPNGSLILGVWAQKTAAMTGTSTDLTFDIGITGGDVDQWVDGWDYDAAAVASFAPVTTTAPQALVTTSDTVDILFATQTGTVTGGKVKVGVVLADITGVPGNPTIAQPKS